MGFATELCQLIDSNIALGKTTNPFLKKVERGTIKVSEIASYLLATKYLLSHTPPHLRLAIEATKDKELKDFFIEHLAEETGHDKWAENDLKTLARIKHILVKKYLSPKMVEHVSWIENRLIREDPWLYPPYILFAEYIAVSAGPWFMERLKIAGIPIKALSVVKNHAQLDSIHIQQDFKIIDQFVGKNPGWKEAYKKIVEKSMENYDSFLSDIVATE
jgi:hypothetical protein